MTARKIIRSAKCIITGCCILCLVFIMVRFALLYHQKMVNEVRLHSFDYQVLTRAGTQVETGISSSTTSYNSKYIDSTIKEKSGNNYVPSTVDVKTIHTTKGLDHNENDVKTTEAPVTSSTNEKPLQPCSKEGENLVGALSVDVSVPHSESHINVAGVMKGGCWRPIKCEPVSRVAIIIPYRKREEQLKIFARHMHPMLQRQLLDYRILVIEQAGKTPFNRAMLFNIGFKESLKFHNFTCFVFHDVDLIPENDKNYYGCPTSPRHLSVAVDKFNYQLPYLGLFGGAGCFIKEHFEMINGFSNKFWGWGGEDDDLFTRTQSKQLKLTRPSVTVGRYKMLRIFHKSAREDPNRFAKLGNSKERMTTDGLNSLKYHVQHIDERPLYTIINVQVNPNEV